MARNDGGNVVPRITKAEHIGPLDTGDNIEAKRVAGYGYDTSADVWRRLSVDADGKLNTTAVFSGDVSAVTEYTDGDAAVATPSGPTLTFDDAGTVRAVSDTNPLPVDATVNASITFAETSALGVNSSNEASNSSYSNWATNTWTGSYEQNDYQYLVVSLQTDDDGGTLYFDFSPDGTNTNTFPVNGFTITEGVHEIHVAMKSNRYFRARYVGTGNRTYFRLYTYYTNSRLELNSPLSNSMTGDNDSIIVKAAHRVQYQTTPSDVADGNFDTPSITRHRQVRTRDQVTLDLQDCNDHTDFTIFNNDTANLAASTRHQFGTNSVEFDKVDGAGNSVYAGVTWSMSSIDIQELFEDGGFVGLGAYLPSINNVVRVILRLGTDSSNYNEWRWEVDDLEANLWNQLRQPTGRPATYAGNGWNTADIDYGAVLIEFNAQSNTLADITIDNIHLVSGRVTDVEQNVSVTSNVTGSKVDVTKLNGNTVTLNTGNADTGTQRVVLASDQPTVSVSASSLPLPSGAATAANQQTDALTDTELRATPVVVDLGANNDVTVTSSALPAGASTSANQTTIIGHLDGVETLLTTIEGNQLPDGHNVTIDNPGDIGGGVQYTEGDTDATFTGTMALVEGAANAAATLKQPTTPSDTQPVSASSLPLPTGAATSANQSTIIGHLDGVEGLLTTIDSDTSTLAATDFATEAKQDDIITAIGAIPGGGGTQYTDGDADATPTGTVALGFDGTNVQALATDSSGNLQAEVINTVTVDGSGVTQPVSAASLPLPTGAATAANQQTDALTDTELRATPVVVDLGSNNDVTVTSSALPTGAATAANQSTVIGHLDGVETLLTTIESNQLPDGHNVTVDNASIAVTGTFWQATQPVSAASLPLPSGAATAANQQTDALTDTELRASPVPVSGTVTANLSATDNAVLDTIAANTAQGGTSAVTAVNDTATSTTLLSANADRKEVYITNDSSADLYVKFGTTASTTSYTLVLGEGETLVDDKYTGRIDGIWASDPGDGAARVTEVD